MKQELGLNHHEGRSWSGLHHHCLLTLIAYAFLQHLRLAGKKNFARASRRLAPRCRRSAAG
jgi:SRSO17 transposase